MKTDYTKIIDSYLQGNMSEVERLQFEQELKTNNTLKAEFELQRDLEESIKRNYLRSVVKNVAKRYHLLKKLYFSGVLILALGLVFLLGIVIWNKLNEKPPLDESKFEELYSSLSENPLIDDLEGEFFIWEGLDTVILSKSGVLLSVPESSFLLNGKSYKGQAVIQWQEALDGPTIVKSGLSTVADSNLLETQGMFSFRAHTPEGELLDINPKTGVYVQIPVEEHKTGMQLYDGVKNEEGIVNWVNPEPLMKIPVPVDMAVLDFYPVGYEDSLNAMKLRKDKKFRDSLYLSCGIPQQRDYITIESGLEERSYNVAVQLNDPNNQNNPNNRNWRNYLKYETSITYHQNNEASINVHVNIAEDWKIFSTNHDPSKSDYLGIPTSFKFELNNNYKLIGELQESKKPLRDINQFGEILHHKNEVTFTQRIKITSISSMNINTGFEFQICNENGCLFPPAIAFTLKINPPQDSAELNFISPSKVLAFWNKKFNNTLLATREFERRMPSIHATCKNEVLDVYVKNLQLPLTELDKRVKEMGYPEFAQFEAEYVGALNPDNPHLKNLQKFYEDNTQKLRSHAQFLKEQEQRKRNKWDKEISEERTKEQSRTESREAQALQEEYTFNYDNVKKQFGGTIGTVIYGNSPIKNVDRQVMEATIARKTAEIVDPTNGKTAILTYNDFGFEVENHTTYGRLYAYLFPSKINSYQRITGEQGKFNYALNNDMLYDVAVIGVNENGYYYFQQTKLNSGDLGKIALTKVSEEKLDASINQLNKLRLNKPMSIKDELKWLFKEQADYVEKERRMKQARFEEKIKQIVFPCYFGQTEAYSATDTLVVVEVPNIYQ